MSVIPSVAVDLCGQLRPSFHPAACSACSPSMSWERKLLHCGPRADLWDLLAHYLFISVLHHGLPRGSDHAWSLTAQAACGGQSPGHGSQMGSCMLLERQFSSTQIFVLSEGSMKPANFFFVSSLSWAVIFKRNSDWHYTCPFIWHGCPSCMK